MMSRAMYLIFRRKGQHLRDELLSSYLDGRVTPRERAEAEQHRATCQECREALAGLQQTVELMHLAPTLVIPRSFVFTELPQSVPRRVLVPAWAVGAVASVTVALFVGIISADISGLLAPGVSPVTLPEQAESVVAEVVAEKEVIKEVEVPVVVEKEVIKEVEVAPVVRAAPPDEMEATPSMAEIAAETPASVPIPSTPTPALDVAGEVPSPQDSTVPLGEGETPRATPVAWHVAEGLLGAAALLLTGFTLLRLRRRRNN